MCARLRSRFRTRRQRGLGAAQPVRASVPGVLRVLLEGVGGRGFRLGLRARSRRRDLRTRHSTALSLPRPRQCFRSEASGS